MALLLSASSRASAHRIRPRSQGSDVSLSEAPREKPKAKLAATYAKYVGLINDADVELLRELYLEHDFLFDLKYVPAGIHCTILANEECLIGWVAYLLAERERKAHALKKGLCVAEKPEPTRVEHGQPEIVRSAEIIVPGAGYIRLKHMRPERDGE